MSKQYHEGEDYFEKDRITELMEDEDLDYEDAEEVAHIMDEGLGVDEAVEIKKSSDGGGGCSWVFWVVAIVIIVLIFNNHKTKKIEKEYNYQVETTGLLNSPDCDSLEPENPYDEGSGHYAGYQWGEEGNYCSGDSDSFIEGCEEYENQEEAYEACSN